MKFYALLFALIAMVPITHAGAVYWATDAGTSFTTTWSGANAYTYFVTATSLDTVKNFAATWTTSYSTEGKTDVFGGLSREYTGDMSVAKLTIADQTPTGGYIVVLLEKDGDAIYSYATATTSIYVGDQDSADMKKTLYFTEDGYDVSPYLTDVTGGPWAKVGTVPEPTAFALLALGVAGLALRRKVK